MACDAVVVTVSVGRPGLRRRESSPRAGRTPAQTTIGPGEARAVSPAGFARKEDTPVLMAAFQVDVQPLDGRPRHPLLPPLAVAAVATAAAIAAVLFGTGTFRFDGLAVSHRDRIAYVDEAGALSALGAGGSDPRAYPMADTSFGFPAFSPDGTRIAAIGTDSVGGGIYVFDDAGRRDPAGAPVPVVVYPKSASNPIYLAWSPGGTRIAFLTNERDGLALRLAPADGSGPSVVVQRGAPLFFDWVDDDRLLVHRGAADPGAFLGEVSADASASPGNLGAPANFQAPGVAAGNAARAFVLASGTGDARVVVESPGVPSRFEAPVAGGSALGWSPRGDQLAFTAPAQANGLPYGPLELMNARTGAIRTLLGGNVIAFFWAPDARTIAVIRIVTTDGATASVVPVAGTPSLSLAFLDVASGAVRSERQIRTSTLFALQYLPFFDQYARSHRVWSAAGDAVVLPLTDESGLAHVTVVPMDGSPTRVIADGVAAAWSP